jgi:hypothetical protein
VTSRVGARVAGAETVATEGQALAFMGSTDALEQAAGATTVQDGEPEPDHRHPAPTGTAPPTRV